MKHLRLTLKPLTAFGTPLAGDTLFGQICWGILQRYGAEKLGSCLQNYLKDDPFLVVSDGFPAGYLPLPSVPSFYWESSENADRKKLKKKKWVPVSALTVMFSQWQSLSYSDEELAEQLVVETVQPHNSINRQTSTTGRGDGFAPYAMPQWWYRSDSEWHIYILLNERLLSQEGLLVVLNDIAQSGYGRDASIGLGKFEIINVEMLPGWGAPAAANAYITLAACCPQGKNFNAQHSFYQMNTKFGRHGGLQATAGNPFKKPVLMAKTGALLRPQKWEPLLFVGQGITGVSETQPEAVQQGYAPAVPVNVSFPE